MLVRSPESEREWPIKYISSMKVENGARDWLIVWKGVDPATGEPWDDSWEPTSNVGQYYRDEYLQQRKEGRAKAITTDISGVDDYIAGEVAVRVAEGDGSDAFGHVYKFPLGVLAIKDVADNYIDRTAARYGLEISTAHATREIRICLPEHVGTFMELQKHKKRIGLQNIMTRIGRVTNSSLSVVACIYIRYSINEKYPGMVNAECEVETVHINGASGTLTQPHMVTGYIRLRSRQNTLITYVRAQMAAHRPQHPLILAGWHLMPPNEHTLANMVGF